MGKHRVTEENSSDKKPSKKRKKSTSSDAIEGDKYIKHREDEVTENVRKKKKRNDEELSDPIIECKKKDKKKKKEKVVSSPITDEDVTLSDTDKSSKKSKKKKKKKHRPLTEEQLPDSPDVDQSSQKKTRFIKDENDHDNLNLTNDSIKSKSKKKKKGKDSENSKDGSIKNSLQEEESPNPEKKKKKKKKKEAKEKEPAVEVEISEIKKKKKKKSKEEKSSNCEESGKPANKGDSHASGSKRPTIGDSKTTTTNSSAAFGQWGNSNFSDSNTQSKFLRLLGGFKKGGSASVNTSGNAGQTTSNMALSEDKAKTLNKALEDQFTKAIDFKLKMEKGSGLGYAPPPGQGKKFFIDTRKTVSTKFDD